MTAYGELLASAERPVEAHEILGQQLRLFREQCGLTLATVAGRLAISQAKVSRIESGKCRVSDEDLHRLFDTYRVSDSSERGALLAFNARLAKGQWWEQYPTALGSWFSSLLVLESLAERVFTYETLFIPGLLQTRAYAQAVIGLADAPAEEIRNRVEVRLGRQQRLFQRSSAPLWAVIGHAALTDALTDGVVSRDVMREQLQHLIRIAGAQSPATSVRLQILPPRLRWLLEAESSFTQLRLPTSRLTDVVYFEHIGDAVFLDTSDRADRFNKTILQLGTRAEKPTQSLDTLRRALAELELAGRVCR